MLVVDGYLLDTGNVARRRECACGEHQPKLNLKVLFYSSFHLATYVIITILNYGFPNVPCPGIMNSMCRGLTARQKQKGTGQVAPNNANM